MLKTLSSTINTNEEGMGNHLTVVENWESSLWPLYNVCFSTLTLRLERTGFVIRDCKWMRWFSIKFNDLSCVWSCVELEMSTIGPHALILMTHFMRVYGESLPLLTSELWVQTRVVFDNLESSCRILQVHVPATNNALQAFKHFDSNLRTTPLITVKRVSQ